MIGLDRTVNAHSHKTNNSKHQDTRDMLSEIRHKNEAIEVVAINTRKHYKTILRARILSSLTAS